MKYKSKPYKIIKENGKYYIQTYDKKHKIEYYTFINIANENKERNKKQCMVISLY